MPGVKISKSQLSSVDNSHIWKMKTRNFKKTYNMETNVSCSFMSKGTLSSFEDTQRFESVFKMTRKTFNYICSLVFGPSMEDMNSYKFIDGRVLCLEDRVAVALRRLYSSEPSETLGSSVGVDESTILLVTERFVDVVFKRAAHHWSWPDSSKVDKIKSTFEKIHNMPNCCGVMCTTPMPFGPNYGHEKNETLLMQGIIDAEMRFMDIWLGSADSMNQSSLLQDSQIFEKCGEGAWLNGSKLNVAIDGSKVGEYIIGDVGYPLLPWLLTPYQEKYLSESKAEFNRRHAVATTCAMKALARFKETWKYLNGQLSCSDNINTLGDIIYGCCVLHNIVIDMEDDADMPSSDPDDWNYSQEVRQLANEDAVRARDMLSQHFLTTSQIRSQPRGCSGGH